VNKAENNEQFDTDILQCKVDILRARNIIPLHDNTAPKKPAAQNSTVETVPAKETAPLPRLSVSINKKEETETLQETPEIPTFDLAEEIMAEQRRLTAIRRKAPGQKNEAQRPELQAQPVDHTKGQPLSEQEKIIAEIVAKDIERLYRGDYSNE
jgi:hypothetical protein